MAKRSNILLDDDIILLQILPRLPARSIGRFKCVCKQWLSFLTTPMFTKMHLHHVNDQNPHRLLVVPTTKSCRYFRTIDCETPEVGLSANRSLPFEANSNEMSIIASLNGLVCVRINSLHPHRGWYSDIILWNPLTGDYKTLSKDNSHGIGYELYYSCCDDDYRLLCLTLYCDAYIYSLKSDSWRKVESTCCPPLEYLISSCLLNENLYFLEQGRKKTNPWSYSILRFNTNTEKFTDIAALPLRYDVEQCCYSLTVVSGCVYLCASSKANSWDKLDLWKMDRDGEWTKVVSCCHRLSKLEFYRPLHLMKNGNWLMGPRGKGYAYEVDLKMKTTKEVWTYTPTPTDGPMHIRLGGKFVETIVSLN